MSDLRWSSVAHLFDADEVGALPDGSVAGTTVADWQATLDLVRTGGRPWHFEESGVVAAEVPAAAELFGDSERMMQALVRVHLGAELVVHLWFLDTGEVSFDVDVRTVRGQAQLDSLCRWFRDVGTCLGKDVVLAEEGDPSAVLLTYDVASDRVIASSRGFVQSTSGQVT